MVHNPRCLLLHLSSWFCSSVLSFSLSGRQMKGTRVKNSISTIDQYWNCDPNTNTCVHILASGLSPSTNSSVLITAVLVEKSSWSSSHHWLLVTPFCFSPLLLTSLLVLLVNGGSVALAPVAVMFHAVISHSDSESESSCELLTPQSVRWK